MNLHAPQAFEIEREIFGAERAILARCLTDLGRWADAEVIYRDVLRAQIGRYGESHPGVAASQAGLARALLDSDRAAEAEPLWRSAQATAIAKFGELDAAVGITAIGLGRTLLALGRYDDAVAQLDLAERVYTQLGKNGTSSLARVRLERTRVDLARTDAIVECTPARGALDAFSTPDANRGYALAVLAACLQARHEPASLETLDEALTLLRRLRDERFPERRYAEALAASWR